MQRRHATCQVLGTECWTLSSIYNEWNKVKGAVWTVALLCQIIGF